MILDNYLHDHIISLFVSLLLGAIIGAEREYKGRNIGFRTIILITIGSSLFTILSGLGEGDHTRIAANIVTGIGFFGAGAIFRDGGTVKGVTTASIIWSSAAVGMACGMQQYEIAFIVTGIILIVSLGFVGMQRVIDRYSRERNYQLTFNRNADHEERVKMMMQQAGLKGGLIRQRADLSEITLEYDLRGPETAHKDFIRLLCSDANLLRYMV